MVYLVPFDWIQLGIVNITGTVEYLKLTVFFFFFEVRSQMVEFFIEKLNISKPCFPVSRTL